MSLAPDDFFDLDAFEHRAIFAGCTHVWDVLAKIGVYVRQCMKPGIHGTVEDGAHVIGDVFIGEGTVVEAGAYVRGPAIIGRNCEIRMGAYIRGDALVGEGCIVGNSTELKNTLLLDRAMAPHYNYCGDSVLGNDSNLGAGTKLSNFKIAADKTIRLVVDGETIDTGLIKFGAILGDGASTGCNAVLNPGTVVGRGSLVYAGAAIRGYVPPGTIVKLRQTFEFGDLR
ncbi:MAG: glucose-1-phosphate thymidylyltransferase [Planctomycetota bacterium]|nr:glucose-1-phosphate thymidylyltransferase [Planctomycetota bacterium]